MTLLQHNNTSFYSQLFHLSDDEDDFNEEDENGNCPLIFAVTSGRLDIVRSLVDQGAFVDHQNRSGETALYWACFQGLDTIVDFLIENKADLNIQNLEGVSPVHIAAANGHVSVLRSLIKNGAYVNIQDEAMDTPLHYAVREARLEIINFLIVECNACKDIKNEDIESPFDLAESLEAVDPQNYQAIVRYLSI